MAQTFSTARMVAREVSKVLGREVSDKRVRAWVRDNIDAYDDDGYTAHQYDARLVQRIVAGMTKSARQARPTAAHNGRKGSKSAVAASKSTSGQKGRVSASQPQGPAMSAPVVQSGNGA